MSKENELRGSNHGKWFHWAPALVQAIFIFVLSSMEGKGSSGGGGLDPIPFSDILFFDKLVHLILYFSLGWALIFGFERSLKCGVGGIEKLILNIRDLILSLQSTRIGRAREFPTLWHSVYFVVVVTGFLYGVTDEIHQFFVPHRTFSVVDLAADFAGVAVACLVHDHYRRRSLRL